VKLTSWFRKMYNRVTKVVPDLPVEVMRVFWFCVFCWFEVILLCFLGFYVYVCWWWWCWFHKIESIFGFGFEDIFRCYLLEFYNLFLIFVV